jgi:hypothetical protein
MSEGQATEKHGVEMSGKEMHSALFAQLVLQQTNMAGMLLGKVPHPETGEVIKDMDAARLFIDQLEMLEAKTKGNLTKEESALLKQSLMSLRLAFVEAMESPTAPAASKGQPETAKGSAEPAGGIQAAPSEEESRKKFSKKY